MRHKRKSSTLFKTFKLFIPVIFVLAILWVWKSTAAKSLAEQLTLLEIQRKTLIEDNKRLQAVLEQYRSVGWIDSRARIDYGMTYDIKNRLILFENQQATVKPVRHDLYAGVLGNLRDIWNFLTGE